MKRPWPSKLTVIAPRRPTRNRIQNMLKFRKPPVVNQNVQKAEQLLALRLLGLPDCLHKLFWERVSQNILTHSPSGMGRRGVGELTGYVQSETRVSRSFSWRGIMQDTIQACSKASSRQTRRRSSPTQRAKHPNVSSLLALIVRTHLVASLLGTEKDIRRSENDCGGRRTRHG